MLLMDNIRCGKRVLDMGTGNGAISIKCAQEGSTVTAVDIDPEALKNLEKIARERNLPIQAVHSDLFAKVEGKYDTIVFNPPYLPGDAKTLEELQWAGGGEYGDEILFQFLREARNYLVEGGTIYVIVSSFNRIERIESMGYTMKCLGKKKFAFHEIYLYELHPHV